MAILNSQQEQALKLYLAAMPIVDIAEKLKVSRHTVMRWRDKFNWQSQAKHKPIGQQLLERIHTLLHIGDKSAEQNKELKMLLSAINDDYARRLDPIKYRQGQNKAGKGKKKNKIKAVKNSFEGITQRDFDSKFKNLLLGYQHKWRQAKIKHSNKVDDMPRTRAILKSRQIGATWYFAAEAFEDAVLTGDNQVFLSASQRQSFIFRSYIKRFSQDWFGVELKGVDSIELWNGAIIYFLATSSRTAQGYHGHVYMDEFFWMPKFDEFNKVASAMAAHKKWRRTYFSTPSAISHDAYNLWAGSRIKKDKKKENVNINNKHLKYGAVGSDRVWRMVTTIDDAQQMGCNFFDIDELKSEHSEAEFNNLFNCKFVDDSDSVFKLSKLQKGVVDPTSWKDFDKEAKRPYANNPVWVGYDPARSRDDASVVVIAPPMQVGGKFRLLERHRWQSQTFVSQASMIKNITEKYNVETIAMDVSGIGYGAFENVQAFFPYVTPITYSSLVKEQMVAKMQDVINSGRFLFQDEDAHIMSSFMAIGKTTTGSGKIVINAKRSDSVGHADVAWAIMHAIYQEPANIDYASRTPSLLRALQGVNGG